MTSAFRTYSTIQKLPTEPVLLITAYYSLQIVQEGPTTYQIFPFTYNNGTLDIALVNNFKADYIDTPGKKPEDTSCTPVHRYRLLGGNGIVTKLGTNFINYIRAAWILPEDSSVSVFQRCIMTKVQEMEEQDDGTMFTEQGFYESPTPPISDGYITNQENFGTSWIFKTPLTISIVSGGIKSYITFATTIGHDNC